MFKITAKNKIWNPYFWMFVVFLYYGIIGCLGNFLHPRVLISDNAAFLTLILFIPPVLAFFLAYKYIKLEYNLNIIENFYLINFIIYIYVCYQIYLIIFFGTVKYYATIDIFSLLYILLSKKNNFYKIIILLFIYLLPFIQDQNNRSIVLHLLLVLALAFSLKINFKFTYALIFIFISLIILGIFQFHQRGLESFDLYEIVVSRVLIEAIGTFEAQALMLNNAVDFSYAELFGYYIANFFSASLVDYFDLTINPLQLVEDNTAKKMQGVSLGQGQGLGGGSFSQLLLMTHGDFSLGLALSLTLSIFTIFIIKCISYSRLSFVGYAIIIINCQSVGRGGLITLIMILASAIKMQIFIYFLSYLHASYINWRFNERS